MQEMKEPINQINQINSGLNYNVQLGNQNPNYGTKEKIINAKNGCCFLPLNIFLFFVAIGGAVGCGISGEVIVIGIGIPICVILWISSIVCFCGYFTNDPNEAQVVTFYGKYVGTIKESGYFWINPCTSRRKISLRAVNFNGNPIKVNDKVGNPIMMGCVVVWRVKDTAKASFDVQDYTHYVSVQSESAVRFVGCMFPYDKVNENDICLRSGHEEVNRVLTQELSERLFTAGLEVQEARITELAYSSEIANAMLKRQAAEAIIAAREKIVQGAVSIVGHALNSLSQNQICELTQEERSKLVANMLIVLCSESQVSPVVNTGN